MRSLVEDGVGEACDEELDVGVEGWCIELGGLVHVVMDGDWLSNGRVMGSHVSGFGA